jgi:hypothetical protein
MVQSLIEAQRMLGAAPAPAGGKPYVPWYQHADEYAFVECMLLCCMLLLALLFEEIFHKIDHHLDHKAEEGGVKTETDQTKFDIIRSGFKPGFYMIRLLNRLTSELMILGFIAFTVWSCNKVGVYEMVVVKDYGPKTGPDLLHVIEDVHMHLFIAMCMYFIVMINCVTSVESAIENWTRHEHSIAAKGFPSELTEEMLLNDTEKCTGFLYKHCNIFFRGNTLRDYYKIRSYFVGWMQRKGAERLKIERFSKSFNFARYLTVYVDEFMDELLVIHPSTWSLLAVLWMIVALLAKTSFAGSNAIDKATLFFAAASNCLMLIFVFVVQHQYSHKERRHHRAKKNDGKPELSRGLSMIDPAAHMGYEAEEDLEDMYQEKDKSPWSFDHLFELGLLRLIQALIMFMCYYVARFISSPYSWDFEVRTTCSETATSLFFFCCFLTTCAKSTSMSTTPSPLRCASLPAA